MFFAVIKVKRKERPVDSVAWPSETETLRTV